MFTREKILLIGLAVFTNMLVARVLAEESAVYYWQREKLMHPSAAELAGEAARQSVFIYQGLLLADVERAMDGQFDRIEHMMFVETVLPAATTTQSPQQEDDGCGD